MKEKKLTIDCVTGNRSEKDWLDLIHHQKAEIERLKEENEQIKVHFVNEMITLADGKDRKIMKLHKQIDELKERVNLYETNATKDTAKKFADLVEFHSIARMNDGVEYFTISALGLKEILTEEFGFKYSELDGVEVE